MDHQNVFQKAGRFLSTTSSASGLAYRVALEKYLNVSIDDAAYAKTLMEFLGNLKGPMMKVAQFLATVPGALPDEYSDAFLTLQSDAPSMGTAFVKRRLKNELGANWANHFTHFDLNARHAASLGQVHKAQLKSGEHVAVKLQYPGMESILETDLSQLHILLGIYQTFNDAIKTKDIEDEIKSRLFEELDYTREAQNTKSFAEIFENNPHVTVPTVYNDISTKRLLTMSWHDGRKIFEYLNAPDDIRHNLADNLFRAWYTPFYDHNMIHGDPHPGNYLVSDHHKLIILDFGCIRQFDTSFVDGVVMLFYALLENDRDKAVAAYTLWGFQDLNNECIDIITEWAKLLYDPLLDDRVRPIQNDTKGQHGLNVAMRVHDALNKAGGIMPPKSFVFMDRAAVGIGAIMMRLNVSLNWHQLFLDVAKNRL